MKGTKNTFIKESLSERDEENIKNIYEEEELEQFLCYLGLRDELLHIFLNKGLSSIEKILNLDKYNFKIIDQKRNLILNNIHKLFERIDEFYRPISTIQEESSENETIPYKKPTFIEIIRSFIFDLNGIKLTKEMLLNGFKMKTKPGNCLPNFFQEKNLTYDKIFASFLSDKKIGILNDNYEGFKNLKHLYLNNNKIQIIQNLNFTSLTILDLSNNYIRKIENIERMVNLQTLNLEKNMISKLENISNNLNLQILNLSKQCLTQYQFFEIDVNKQSENLPPQYNLQELSLDHCNIIDPTNLCYFTKLKKLKICNNKISEMGAVLTILKCYPDLEYLSLSNNEVIEMNKNFRDLIVICCKKLVELDDKTITLNEKQYVNSLYTRKYTQIKNQNEGKQIAPYKQKMSLEIIHMNHDEAKNINIDKRSLTTNNTMRSKSKKYI